MLTATRQDDGQKVSARDAQKSQAPFHCPKCRSEVVLHKGNIKTHHFKHKPPISCSWGQGETNGHYLAKLGVYDALTKEPNVSGAELEKDFGATVADVFAVIEGVPVAVEIQRSNLSVAEITSRTQNYYRLGISVLWVALPNESLWEERYSPSAWERWCHAAYFGRVYYWDEGQRFHVVHFSPYLLYVQESSWFDSDGSERFAGGYERFSKRYKTPWHGKCVALCKDFRPKVKSAYSSGTISIPPCRLYLDRQPKWWD
jgi:competence protein CoiA